MATIFFELATTLKNLGAKWLSEKKSISHPEAKYRFLLLTIQWQVDWISVYKYLLGSVFGKDDVAGRKMELLFASYRNVNYAVI